MIEYDISDLISPFTMEPVYTQCSVKGLDTKIWITSRYSKYSNDILVVTLNFGRDKGMIYHDFILECNNDTYEIPPLYNTKLLLDNMHISSIIKPYYIKNDSFIPMPVILRNCVIVDIVKKGYKNYANYIIEKRK